MNLGLSETNQSGAEVRQRGPAFHEYAWKARWIAAGLAFIVLWRSLYTVGGEWFEPFHALVWFVVFEAFLLVFPVITRTRPECPASIPARRVRWRREMGISIPIVLGTITILSAANYAVEQIFPGTTLSQSDMSNEMVWSPNRALAFAVLICWFTIGPLAEEVFFRGFLLNAFRQRMPLPAAVVLQSAIFGGLHFYGPLGNSLVFVLSLLLSLVYLWRGTLLAPLFVHAGLNFLMALAVAATMFLQSIAPVIGFRGDASDANCVIHEVVAGSAAEEAGLQAGDTLISFDDEPIRDFKHLLETIRYYRPGDAVPVIVDRSGELVDAIVVLRKRE